MQYLRDLSPKDTKHCQVLLIDNGETITDPKQIANIYNDFFSSIADKYINNNTEQQTNDSKLKDFIDNKLRPEDFNTIALMTNEFVQKQLTGLATNRATVLDGVGAKHCSHYYCRGH